MKPRPLVLVAILSLLWGSEWIASMELDDLPRLRVIAVRCLVAAVVLMPFAAQARRKSAAAGIVAMREPGLLYNNVASGRNCLLGLGLIAAPVLLSSFATNISSGLAVVLFAAMPLIATLFEGGTGIAGAPYMLGGLLGIAFLVRGSLSFSFTQGLSVLWIWLSVVCVAASMVRAKQWLQGQNLAGAMAVQMLSAAATIGTFSYFREPSSGPWTLRESIVVGLLGITGSAVAYLLFFRLLNVLRASQLAVLQWLTPVIGVLEAALWLRRWPTWEKAAGAALTIACAVLMLRLRSDDVDTTSAGISPLTLKITLL